MLAYITVNNAAHQKEHAAAIKAALNLAGINCIFGDRHSARRCDMIVTWGYKPPRLIDQIKSWGIPHLVMERGYLPDRFVFSSMGWNGLNNRATFPACNDGGERFRANWPDLIKPWREEPENGHVLLCGQVPGDAAVYGCDMGAWAQHATDKLMAAGHKVLYRPHPFVKRHGPVICPKGAALSSSDSLEADLDGAKFCATFNSNAGVEAALYGVPNVAMDPGSMAWLVSAHDIDDAPVRPPREAWAHGLAWCNWRIGEIADGTAWKALAPLIR